MKNERTKRRIDWKRRAINAESSLSEARDELDAAYKRIAELEAELKRLSSSDTGANK